MAEIEVQYLIVGGKTEIPAALAVCPVCHVLDMGTTFNTKVTPYQVECTKGHEWTIDPVVH